MKSLKGHFLVASPHLEDPNFTQSVVLLVQHDEDGTFGIVLNRPAESSLKDLWEKVTEKPCETDKRVHVGGPVPGPLIACTRTVTWRNPNRRSSPAFILPSIGSGWRNS